MFVAAGAQSMREREQCALFHVEHALLLQPGVGRERGVEQHGDRKVARGRTRIDEDPFAARCSGLPIGDVADESGKVDVETIRFCVQQPPLGAQRLELTPHLPNSALHKRVGRPILPDL